MPITLNASTSSGLITTPDNSGQIAFQNNGTTELTVNAFGIGLGTAVPSSGTGITFPAVQDPSSDANTLDDYEEGTWTPSIGGNATYLNNGRWGIYTKIGNIVNCQFRVSISSKGTGNNNIVDGLPFAVASGNGQGGEAQVGSVGYFESLNTSFVFLSLYAFNSSIVFTTLTAASGTIGQTTVWQNGAIIYGQITYRVA